MGKKKSKKNKRDSTIPRTEDQEEEAEGVLQSPLTPHSHHQTGKTEFL